MPEIVIGARTIPYEVLRSARAALARCPRRALRLKEAILDQ